MYQSYSGALGACMTIRSLVAHNGKMYTQAGAGIVADSCPESEYKEVQSKVKAMLHAVGLAENDTDYR